MHLFEPGPGSQVHDFNGGIIASGLFWTVPVDDNALWVSHDGRRAVLQADEGACDRLLPVLRPESDTGLRELPRRVARHGSVCRAWVRYGRAANRLGSLPGRFAIGRSTAAFEGSEFGFSFRSDPGASSDRGWAELGRERNGVFP